MIPQDSFSFFQFIYKYICISNLFSKSSIYSFTQKDCCLIWIISSFNFSPKLSISGFTSFFIDKFSISKSNFRISSSLFCIFHSTNLTILSIEELLVTPLLWNQSILIFLFIFNLIN